MIGDRLLIRDYHTRVAHLIADELKGSFGRSIGRRYAVSISGESGAGKSETAAELKRRFDERGLHAIVLAQDDYFVYPPKTNHAMRLKNIDQVGPSEVKLDLMDANIFAFRNVQGLVYKPLVDHPEDKITHTILDVSPFDVVIAEGTYTGLLEFIDCRIFLDRTYLQTLADRRERGREPPDPFIEEVLEREHRVIRTQLERANIVVAADFDDITVVDGSFK